MTSVTPQFQLLVVDDDEMIIESIKLVLPKNWQLSAVSKINDFKNLLRTKKMFHAAMVDLHLTGDLRVSEGPQIISELKNNLPQIEVMAMSGDLSLDLMEACLKSGAQRFLAKPLLPEEVTANLEKIEALWMMRTLESRGAASHLVRWIGTSNASTEIKKQIALLRGEPGPILIEGETGTGKEVAFRLLNQQEINRPFVTVNIASIPENLFESEIFGHVKGSFTGADQNKIGLAEAAHGGDLFLDEIEALPLQQQVKLLRFLESGEVRKIGAKDSIIVNCRVICASNQNLVTLVQQGLFREDLLFRLNSKKIILPPLRDRTEDIPELCQFFLQKQKPRLNKMFSTDCLDYFKKYTWPGNIRELKRICEQLALVSPLPIIRSEDAEHLLTTNLQQTTLNVIDWALSLDDLMMKYEKLVIEKCLERIPDVDQAADHLKISRSSLYKKIKDHQIR